MVAAGAALAAGTGAIEVAGCATTSAAAAAEVAEGACSGDGGGEDFFAAEAGPTTNVEDQRDAAALRGDAALSESRGGTASGAALSKLPGVVIDEGTFKYVLLRVSASTGEQRYLVRGAAGASYHKDVAAPYVRQYLSDGFVVDILGGGRIQHNREGKTVQIYGFSYGFPWAKGAGHEISAEVIREHFPSYDNVEWSNTGY